MYTILINILKRNTDRVKIPGLKTIEFILKMLKYTRKKKLLIKTLHNNFSILLQTIYRLNLIT